MVLTGGHDYTRFDTQRQWSAPKGNRDIVIGRGVWVGSGAIILGGVTICDHAVIAAGSVVTRSCPQQGIYAGIPARLIKPIK
ncbi:MAG TPA: acyltransferase [Bryobacteraceae bacterium]|nr:acyltransferase [Bryobacteraceae bacterium]